MPRRAPRWLFLIPLLLAGRAVADEPVLHEYFDSDPAEDLRLAATTEDGLLPAAIQTPSGVVSAPERQKRAREVAYGGLSSADGEGASYQIDRDTSRPGVVRYDDPFTPSITPFKRLYVYDGVDAALELVVRGKQLTPIRMGDAARAEEDQFYADLLVDIVPETPVRIPSVGPGARVLGARLEPPGTFSIQQDGADNWYLTASQRVRARLVMQLAIPRAVFGSPFPDVDWETLSHFAHPLPEDAKPVALRVLDRIGVSRSMSPKAALGSLVSYFRQFVPSEETPEAQSALLLYEELSRSQKGVCRHRAYAFVVTALGLGLPARFVRNEAHAWVEVFDASIWHRIDLGGAASELRYETNPDAPSYRGPNDPFLWPENSERGQDLADGSQPSGAASSDSSPAASSSSTARTGAPGPSASEASRSPAADASADAARRDAHNANLSSSELSLEVAATQVLRGMPFDVHGTVQAGGTVCPFARVDISLEANGKKSIIAALPTDDAGRFSGKLTVPLNVAVGEYRILASTPGAGSCGKSR